MTTTTYLELDDQATGANDNTWGDVADANFAILELAIARVLGIATTGGTTTLTSAQNRYPIINVTGILASNGIIAVKTQEKNFIVINNTTGAYTLTVKTAAGTGKTIPRGRACKVYCDGTNVLLAREQAIPSAQAGGTADVITATFEPAFIAAEIQDGTAVLVEASGANTVTTPTFNPDGIGAATIKKNGAQALAVGDIPRIGYKMLLVKDDSGGHWELLNPNISVVPTAASTTETLTGTDTAKFLTANGLAALWEKGSDIASDTTITIGEGGYHHVTGTTTIEDIDFATAKDGRPAVLVFDGILQLTHSSTLPLQGSANITTAAGDMLFVWQDNGDTVKTHFVRATGRALVEPTSGGETLLETITATGSNTVTTAQIAAGYNYLRFEFEETGMNSSGGASFTMQVSGDNGTNWGVAVEVAQDNLASGTRYAGNVFIYGINSLLQNTAHFVSRLLRLTNTTTDTGDLPTTETATVLKHATGGTSRIDKVRFVTSGTWTNMSCKVYGVK